MEEYLKFEEKASRLELFIRIIYSFIIGIILGIYGFIAGICQIIQWILILITGSRIESINNIIKGYVTYAIQVYSYLSLLTDERPELTPQNIKIFLEK